MKMQIAFDMTDLDKAISIASEVSDFADILEVGSLLLYKYGETAVREFKEAFPQKTIFVDSKIVDHGKETATLLAYSGADYMTVMSGTVPTIIRNVSSAAHEQGKKVALDLLNAYSFGQSALDAKSLGIDALIIHRPSSPDEEFLFLDRWEMVKSNTELPIYISSHISKDNIKDVINFNPAGIIIGKAITQATNPKEEANFFYEIISK
jgi:3-hexulose-6-phosphate synthase